MVSGTGNFFLHGLIRYYLVNMYMFVEAFLALVGVLWWCWVLRVIGPPFPSTRSHRPLGRMYLATPRYSPHHHFEHRVPHLNGYEGPRR